MKFIIELFVEFPPEIDISNSVYIGLTHYTELEMSISGGQPFQDRLYN